MIRQIISLMALLFFATSMLGMQRCFVCEGMRQEPFVTLACNHIYHPSCIFFICDATKCPQCNYVISPEQKEELQRIKATLGKPKPKVYRSYQKCFICDNRIPELESEDFIILNCDHAYHPTCILAWSVINPSCPQCKHPISPEQQTYFEHIIDDDIPTLDPDVPPQKYSFMSRYKTPLIVACCGTTALVCYYYQDNIVAWFKKGSYKQQEIL